MKLYLILIVLVLTSCMPASKKALEETNQNVLAIAKHAQMQDKVIGITTKKVFGESITPVNNALQNSSNLIAKQAEETGAKDVGIFNFSAVVNTVVSLVKDYGQIALDIASSTPYGPMITAGVGVVTTLLGKGALDGILSRRKEKVKKEILKRQDPNDAKKFDDLVANVEKEIKEGKIKV
jgi:hypothetical protein